jgi:hypothetical protein
MGGTRAFGAEQGHIPPVRSIDNDAPAPMRQEILAVAYDLLPHSGPSFREGDLYYGIEQLLGQQAAGNPMAGWRQRLGRDLADAQWTRIYDIICWLWHRFRVAGMHDVFREHVNQLLAAHAVAWDLGDDGKLHRVLPATAQTQVKAAFAELSDPRYAPALVLFNAATDAYDDRPRRDRDACSNVFDAMESVTKTKYNLPQATFGQVIAHIEQQQAQAPGHNAFRVDTIEILRKINDLRNHHFGHGMVGNFELTPPEVDFTYLACIGAILLLTRTT